MIITHHQDGQQGFFLAEENGRRMGYLSYEWESPIRFAILHTVVEKAYQGHGVAKALVDAAVDFAREKGYTILPVCPYAENLFKRDTSYEDIL